MIVALLSGITGIITTVVFVKCNSNYPDFLRLPYYILTLIVIILSYVQLAYFGYGLVRKLNPESSSAASV
jgi:hypothetical protein